MTHWLMNAVNNIKLGSERKSLKNLGALNTKISPTMSLELKNLGLEILRQYP